MRKLLITKKEFILIFLGTTLMALAINWFTSPLGLVTGGISGIGIIIQEVSSKTIRFEIPIWITNLILNIPLFVISIKQRGVKFAKKSLWAVGLMTFSLWYTRFIPNIFASNNDLLLGAVFGGGLLGLGIGTVLRSGATTGGTDMLASIIRFYGKQLPIAKLMLGIDAIIILIGLFIFGSTKAMYAMIAVYITSKVITNVLEGVNYAKAAFIMSNKSDLIAEAIMSRIPRGVTGLKAKGMYSKEAKEMLYVVVSKKQIMQLRQIVYEIDEKAFITIADVREVLGEGFIENDAEML